MSLFRLTLFMLDHDNETRECALIVQATDGDPTAAFPPILPAGVETDSVAQEVLTPAEARARFEIALRKHYPAFDPARAADNELTRTVRNQGRAIERIESAIERLASLMGASLVGDEAAREILRQGGNVNPPPPRPAPLKVDVDRFLGAARALHVVNEAEALAVAAHPGMPISIPPGTRLREVVVGGQRVKVVEKLELDTAETVDDDAPAPRVCGGTLGHVFAEIDYAEVKPGTRCQCGALVRTQTGIGLTGATAPPIVPDEVDWGKIAREAPVGHRFDPPVPIDFSTAPPSHDRYAKLEDRAGERGLENIRSTSMNVGTNRSEIEKFGPDGKLVKEPLPRFGESLPARSDIK